MGASRPLSSDIEIDWCTDPALAGPLASFFVESVDPSYISHGEIEGGRATAQGCWASDLEARIRRELELALAPKAHEPAKRIALARRGQAILALSVVSLHDPGRPRYAVIEDLVVTRDERGRGLGAAVLAFTESWLRATGVRRVLLESGVENQQAHEFFARHGFVTCSVTMLKELG